MNKPTLITTTKPSQTQKVSTPQQKSQETKKSKQTNHAQENRSPQPISSYHYTYTPVEREGKTIMAPMLPNLTD